MNLRIITNGFVLLQFFSSGVYSSKTHYGESTLNKDGEQYIHNNKESKKYDYQREQNNNNRKAYVTLITSDREVDKSLVMLASLFAMTKTKNTLLSDLNYGNDDSNPSSNNRDENGQCTIDGNTKNVQCDYNKYVHDYICLIIPKENNENFEHDILLKKFNLGVSHSNVQKLIWAGCDVKPIPYSIYNPNYVVNKEEKHSKNERDENENEILWSRVNYNQIWIWSLKPHYDTVIYITSDHLVLSNINYLFDRSYGRSLTESFIAAPHDQIIPNHFDSSFMIIEPDTSLFQEMLNYVKQGDIGFKIKEDSMAQMHNVQHFLNTKIFPNWFFMPSIHRLESIYNVPYEWTFHEYIWVANRNDIKVFHFAFYNQPEEIIRNPDKYQISKYAAPIIYLWSLIMFFITAPLVNLEEETRYVLHEVFRVSDDSEDVIAYIERMKRGGTRRRLGLQYE